jgi:hypothetical protein
MTSSQAQGMQKVGNVLGIFEANTSKATDKKTE